MIDRFVNDSPLGADWFIGSVSQLFGTVNGYPLLFIIWNIFLAALTVFIGYGVAKILVTRQSKIVKIISVLIWLLFLPNAAYLMTDARHIIGYCSFDSYGRVCAENAWMTLFFFAYACLGWPAFVYSLKPIKELAAKKLSAVRAWLLTVGVCVLTALGVMLGLINRWNSWEIFTNPLGILASALRFAWDGVYLVNWFMASVILLFLYVLGEKVFKKTFN